jgi:3-oxo-5alpha-steroid 4-dehydrogenase
MAASTNETAGTELVDLRDAKSTQIDTPLEARDVRRWTGEYDVIVVGYGIAGASAALEAARGGLTVLLLDRFQGGGSSQMSGGIVYAGGGTHVQEECDVADNPDGMYDYLRKEVGGLVSDQTVRKFADDSIDTLAFLESCGVNFGGPRAPKKTSHPTAEYYLYYSDNGTVPAYLGKHPPAERGHRTINPALVKGAPPLAGKKPHGGFSEGADNGWYLMAAMKQTIEAHPGITVVRQARANRMIMDGERVVGVHAEVMGSGAAAALHRGAEQFAAKLTLQMIGLDRPFAKAFRSLERTRAKSCHYRARLGVVISAGGFVRNQAMMERYAAPYIKSLPIGSFGDDGAGIRLGASAGGVAGHLDKISAWRFINPPFDWTKGVVIGCSGDRIINEEVYGAHLSRAIYEVSDGRAWLVVDQAIWDQALAEVQSGKLFAFQKFPVKQAQKGAKKADTIEELADQIGVPRGKMAAAVKAYSDAATVEAPDPMGKSNGCCQAFGLGPYYAINLTHEMPVSPITSLTTGGLMVDENTGGVLNASGQAIPGLYAAGRSAVGIPSNNYVSGLSLADGVWSGRRAARALADRSN